ncbi:MAG TPA: hypothetical protein ENK52_05325, partial [Saprospiraceae bacterium]|nr:hypothetical protein [Saprospiraceae bacterium]
MLVISCEEHHDKVHCHEEEIILSGPPSFLTGYITFQNNHQNDVFISELPLKHNNKHTKSLPTQLAINTGLSVNETKSHFTHFTINPTTPSGTYH